MSHTPVSRQQITEAGSDPDLVHIPVAVDATTGLTCNAAPD